jgi:hypothetical protein
MATWLEGNLEMYGEMVTNNFRWIRNGSSVPSTIQLVSSFASERDSWLNKMPGPTNAASTWIIEFTILFYNGL